MARRGSMVLGATLLLAACGGGGGGSVSLTVGSPEPALVQAGFILPSAANGGTLIAQDGFAAVDDRGLFNGGFFTSNTFSGGIFRSGVNSADRARLATTPDGRTTFSLDGSPEVFIRPPTALGAVEVSQTADGQTAVITARGGAAQAGSAGRLAHTSYGIWLDSDGLSVLAGPSGELNSVASFAVGTPTPVAEVPRAGIATYRGQAIAVEISDGASPRPLSGVLDATADFNTGRLTATTALDDARTGQAFATITLSGASGGMAISGNAFGGTASSNLGHAGTAQGGFTGSRAAELGGTFALSGPSVVYGSYAAKRR